MREALAFALLIILSAPCATAAPGDPDQIGFFMDQDGECPHLSAAPYTTVSMYLMVTNPSRAGGIGEWEATVLINPTSFPAGFSLDLGPGAMNTLTEPFFQVGLSPARVGNPTLLVTFSAFYTGGPVLFGVGPCVPSSFDGLTPGYHDGADPNVLVPLHAPNMPWTWPAWGVAGPVNAPPNSHFCGDINGPLFDCLGDAAEPSSWGSVKALYR